jgi:hypothetical protein
MLKFDHAISAGVSLTGTFFVHPFTQKGTSMIIKALEYAGITFGLGFVISMIVAGIINLIAVFLKEKNSNAKA